MTGESRSSIADKSAVRRGANRTRSSGGFAVSHQWTYDLADDFIAEEATSSEVKLISSHISAEVANARGYRHISDKADATMAGMASYGFDQDLMANHAGLLIPGHSLGGQTFAQYRPEVPRKAKKDGKVRKYETPPRQPRLLDVNPLIRANLGDVTIPLLVTESILKADSAITIGFKAVIGLMGTPGWWGTLGDGTTGPLEDWHRIKLDGRQVLVAFDGDLMFNRNVEGEARKLTLFLAEQGAEVQWIVLPEDKMGLDDYIRAEYDRTGSIGVDDICRLAHKPTILWLDDPAFNPKAQEILKQRKLWRWADRRAKQDEEGAIADRLPSSGSLAEQLAIPDEPLTYRVPLLPLCYPTLPLVRGDVLLPLTPPL